jgi:hypothetical protein
MQIILCFSVLQVAGAFQNYHPLVLCSFWQEVNPICQTVNQDKLLSTVNGYKADGRGFDSWQGLDISLC